MRQQVVLIFAFLLSMQVFAADTELSFYRPWTETAKQLPLVVVAKLSGACTQQSHVIKRDDAWYCFAGDKVYDPCFVKPYGSHLEAICPESPWSNKAVQITVSSSMDNTQHEALDMSRTFPWALELSAGEKCQAVDSSERYDGLPVRYRCNTGGELIGHLQRCNSEWKILRHQATGVDTVSITRAWF